MKKFSMTMEEENIISVLGISMGDEGKGRVVHEILNQIHEETGSNAECVMKVNGGANAGHTAAGLKLNLLPSGVGNNGVNKLLIGSGVVADPRKFHWEARPLEEIGISVYERLVIDQKTQVSDLTHRLLDLAWEYYRVTFLGESKRGSTGRGISPAYNDETGQWQVFYQCFLGDRQEFTKKLRNKVTRAMDTIKYVCRVNSENWYKFFDILTEAETRANQNSIKIGLFPASEFEFNKFLKKEPFEIDFEMLEEIYWDAGKKLAECISDGRAILLDSIKNNKKILAEFGQSFWLDKRHGFAPNVTASHTFGGEIFMSGGIPIHKFTQVACCKAYDTKVGTHQFITEIDHENDHWGKKLAKLEFGTSTGRQRMVGWYDAVEKGNALKYGGFDELVINKLDALTLTGIENEKIKICTAYQDRKGNTLKEVPRNESVRKELTPIYEEFEGWSSNIDDIRSYEKLPLNAKLFVNRLITSIIEVAYPDDWGERLLPNVRFIGVGPDPKQIVLNVPETKTLMQQSLAVEKQKR